MKTIQLLLAIAMLFASSVNYAQNTTFSSKNSSIKWHGEKVTGEHFGTIELKNGYLETENGNIKGGKFSIDMSTIANTDIEDAEYKTRLEGHLKSDDFFGVANYPLSTLEITEATPFVNGKSKVKALLTIKQTTLPIEFEVSQNADQLLANITVDRAKYDVRYGSGSFFDGLGDKMIYDNFNLEVALYPNK